MNRIAFRLFWFGLLAAVTVGSLLPAAAQPDISLWDKAQHFAAYLLLAALFPFRAGRRPLVAAFAFTACYGVLMELLQGALPTLGRTADPRDAFANALGAACGVGVILLLGLARNGHERA